MQIIISTLIAYLLGSISFSYLAGKRLRGIDIRTQGSGNAGATNTLRVLGIGPAITVFVLDALKGVAAVKIANYLCPGQPIAAVLCGICVIIGHNWPIFFGFKGGKGIATTIGVMFALSFFPTLFAAMIAVIAISITRYVSLGSLLFTLFIPFFILILHYPVILFWAACVVMIFAWIRHRSNIVKLLKGTENKLGVKKTV